MYSTYSGIHEKKLFYAKLCTLAEGVDCRLYAVSYICSQIEGIMNIQRDTILNIDSVMQNYGNIILCAPLTNVVIKFRNTLLFKAY